MGAGCGKEAGEEGHSKRPEETVSSKRLHAVNDTKSNDLDPSTSAQEADLLIAAPEVLKEAGLVESVDGAGEREDRGKASKAAPPRAASPVSSGQAQKDLAGADLESLRPPVGVLRAQSSEAGDLADESCRVFESSRRKSLPAYPRPAEGDLQMLTDFKKHYKIGKTLGKGAFSTVKVVTNRDTEEKFAVKIIKTGSGGKAEMKDVERELSILRQVQHESIMKYVAVFKEEQKIYIVTELLKGGELMDFLMEKGTYTEEEAQICFKQVLGALKYMHSKRIIHRDLKLENLLMRDTGDVGTVKLSDFGMAKYADHPEAEKAVIGTPLYLAPEIINEDESVVNPYDTPGDMWSAGVVLHILLAGFPPFYSETQPALFDMIRNADYNFEDPVWRGVSDSAKSLISKLLVVDPAQRLSAEEAMSHPWCTEPVQQSDLTQACKNMRAMARKKLRKSVKSVLAMHRFAKFGGGGFPLAAASAAPDSDEEEEDEKEELTPRPLPAESSNPGPAHSSKAHAQILATVSSMRQVVSFSDFH